MKRTKLLYQKAIAKYGKDAQIEQLEEELAELTLAIKHYKKGKVTLDDVITELVDVDIMVEQTRMIIGIDDKVYYKHKEYKKKRLEKRL